MVLRLEDGVSQLRGRGAQRGRGGGALGRGDQGEQWSSPQVRRQLLLPYAAGGGGGGWKDGGEERGTGEGGELAKRGEKSWIGERSIGSSGLHTYCKFTRLKISGDPASNRHQDIKISRQNADMK